MRIPHEGRWSAWVLALISAALLAGCGGGGSTGSSDAPQAAAPRLSLSRNSVAVQGATGAATPASISIKLSIANAPASSLPSSVSSSGDAVAAASASWQSTSEGEVTIDFAPPDQLGAGNFTQTITLNVCTDTPCAHPIAGSPATITVTYAVSGVALPPVSFYFPQPLAGFQSTTSDTAPRTTDFNFYIRNVPPAGLYAHITQSDGGFVTAVTDSASRSTNGEVDVTLTLTLQSPASLGSGFFNSSVSVAICYDAACNKPVAGSPVSVPIQYTVYLTQGKEYSLVSSAVGGISDLAYEPLRGSIYVTALAGYPSSYSGAVTEVSPANGAVVTQFSLNDGLSHVAVSDDGHYVYAASKTSSLIYRLTLPALTPDISIDLGMASTAQGVLPNIAGGMAVAPGAARALAVALAHSAGPNQSQGVAIFDDATPRAQALAPLGNYTGVDSIVWGAASDTLYVARASQQQPEDREIDLLSVGPAGLTLASSVNITGTSDTAGSMVYASGKLYEASGLLRDATSLAVLSRVPLPPSTLTPSPFGILCMTPDVANNRLFVLSSNWQSSHLYLLVYTLPAMTMQGVIDLGYDNGDGTLQTHLILWGSQGVAFNRNGLQILSGIFSGSANDGTTAVARRVTRPPQHNILIGGAASRT